MYRVSSKSIDFSISSLIQSFQSRQNAENEQKMTWLVSSTWSVRVIFKSITRKLFTKISLILLDPNYRSKWYSSPYNRWILIHPIWWILKKIKNRRSLKKFVGKFSAGFPDFPIVEKNWWVLVNLSVPGFGILERPQENFLENILSHA